MKQTFISKKIFGVRHDYDLDNPMIKELAGRSIYGYRCRLCTNQLWLGLHQMKSLPNALKYGCNETIK